MKDNRSAQRIINYFFRYPLPLAMVLLTVATALLFYLEYLREEQRLVDSTQVSFSERINSLELSIGKAVVSLTLATDWATNLLTTAAPEMLYRQLSPNLIYTTDGDYFSIGPVAGIQGNVFGSGKPTDRAKHFITEFGLSVSLLPWFKAAKKESNAIVQSYFVSETQVCSAYPPIPPNMLLPFGKGNIAAAFDRFYEPHKGKQSNPDRQPYFLDPYVDRTGQGLVVTYAHPIYHGERFVGIVATDITLGFLQSFTEKIGGLNAWLLLVDEHGQVLSDSENIENGIENLKQRLPDQLSNLWQDLAKGNAPSRLGKYYITAHRLENAPWTFIQIIDSRMLSKRLLLSKITFSIGLLVLIAFLSVAYFAIRRSRLEGDLRESEERFALAMQGANDGLYDWNLETGTIYFSPRWKSMLGYSEHEVEPTSDGWKALVHPDDLSQVTDSVKQCLAGTADRYAFEFRMRHKDGHYLDILSRASALRRDSGGKPIRIVGTHVDISERKRIETQMARLANERSIILENTPVGIAYLKDRVIVWLNNTFAKLYGYEIEEMQGASTEICHPSREAYEQRGAEAYPVMARGETYRNECLMKRKDGSLFWCRISGEAVNPESLSEGSIWMAEDISERLKAEEYARRQAQIMDQIHDSVVAMDLDGMITSWNKGSENLFKYKSDEVIGRHISLVYPAQTREWLQNEIIPDLLAHEFLEMETTLIPKNGQNFDALVSLSVLRNKNNNINGMIGYTINITDRKQIERELQASEAKFHALFDYAPIPLGYIDNTDTIIDINAKFTQVFGYTRTDIPTADVWLKLAFPEPAIRRWVILKRETALRKSRDEGVDVGPFEYQVTCKNGEVKHVYTSYTALQDSFLAAFVDITDLRRAEEAERRSNTLYREITKKSGEGINIADLEGNYVSVNPAFCRMTGYSEAELLGMNVKDLVPSGVKMSLFPKVLRGEEGRREIELVRKDGSHFVAEIHGYPLALENQNLAFGNVRDITERIQAEEQIKASLKEKEVLLREIHHRVKNNLAVIISLLNLQAYQFKDEHIAAALQDSRDRVKSMALIHEILYQSKDIAEISLKEYAPTLGNRLLQAMRGKTGLIQMVYEIEDIILDIDHAIPCGLILNELLTNALKYAFPEGSGEVRVAAHYTETDEIELVVKDDGVGLPKGLDIANSDTLGLNIVWTLTVNQLEGTLDVRNENGSIFTIRWPLPTDKGEKD